MAHFLAALALVLAAATVPAANAADPAIHAPTETLKLGDDRLERMTVVVNIGATGPYRFLLDTGAQNTVLSTELAGRLGLAAKAGYRVLGIAGSRDVGTVEIDDIRLGRRSYDGLIAPLLAEGDIGADGIIGLDGLQGQRLLLDFRRNTITIADARSLGGNAGFEIVVTARRRSGQLILTNAQVDGVYADVVIDTGAETSIGNRALQRALAHRHEGTAATLRSVTGQEIAAEEMIADSLTIDRIEIGHVGIAYADAPTFAALGLGRRPALMLGMRELRLFHRVAIDFSTRKVLFDLPKAG